MKRILFAAVAAVLSTATPAFAQNAEPETLTRVIYRGQILPGAMVLRNAGRDGYDMAVVDTLNFCDSNGSRSNANRWSGYDLDLSGSVRSGGRNGNAGARFTGDVLEFYEDRANDRQRNLERSRDSFCDDVQDEFRDIRSQQRRDRRAAARQERRARRG